MPEYKHGKQTDTIDFEMFMDRMKRAKCYDPLRDKSFVALLYWVGCRKSEAYERVREDFVIDEDKLTINFHQRKKDGLETSPIELPFDLPYTKLIAKQIERTSPKQRVWNIGSTTAWTIVKNILGEKYYPHYLRLNRITRMFDDPTTTIPEAKSWTGIKTTKALDHYIGYSKRRMRKGVVRLRREIATETIREEET